MKVYALSTARDGSKSVKHKNTMKIKDKSLYLYNIIESMNTPEIMDTYLTTDIPEAIENALSYGYKIIVRPDELCTDSSTHTDTIYHGLMEIEKDIETEVDILVVMLGNTINMDRYVVKNAINMLETDETLDSVITVIKINHFNPIRAYVDDGNGYINTFLNQDYIGDFLSKKHLSDKNAMGDILFQNGLWIIRRRAIINAIQKQGLLPFQWFGNKIKYIIQDPSLQEIDDIYQINLIKDILVNEIK